MFNRVDYVIASNNENVLMNNILKSEDLQSGETEIIILKEYDCIGSAYNYGINNSKNPILCFVHQDVFLPSGWERKLIEAILTIERDDPNWAVIGIVGISYEGAICGRCWSNGLQREVFGHIDVATPAVSVDELLIVVRRQSSLLFDENLPGFHFYGTDIVQTALENGYHSYIINNPVIHNSLPVLKWDDNMTKTYQYMQLKWRHKLPLKTTITTINKSRKTLLKHRMKSLLTFKNRSNFSRLSNPEQTAKDLGYLSVHNCLDISTKSCC